MDKRVLVRTKTAGVFFGELTARSEDGFRGTVLNARRIWYWDGAASLSQLAVEGTKKPQTCKFPTPVESIEVNEIIEVLPVTEVAASSIDAVKIWSA